jgi:methyl-accepting chemotaxis protein
LVHKALACLVLLFGASLVATAVSSGLRIDRNLTEQYEIRGRAIAESIAASSVEVLLFRDVSTIQATIDQYLAIQGISYVFVVDKNGEIISHTFVPSIPEEFLKITDSGTEAKTRTIYVDGGAEFMDISAPILGGRIGYVHVCMDRELIRDAIWSNLQHQLAILGLIFLVGLVAASLLVNKIVQPLNRLTSYAKKIAASNSMADAPGEPGAEILPVTARSDEVGQLARAFRHLVLEVASREKELRKGRDALEVRVHERTLELSRTNAALQEEISERKGAEEALRQKGEELERFNRLAVGRELRMIELKRQVNELAQGLGKPAPYDLSFVAEEQPTGAE